MDVLIFATNVDNRKAVNKVQPLLTAVPAIEQWNIDLEDCDHILRVVSNELCPREVESLLQSAGFDCRELDY
jgi:hypothetical protein